MMECSKNPSEILELRRSFEPYEMHRAARVGDISKMKALLDRGFFVNVMDSDRVTPLHEACLSGHTQAVEFLLQNDAWVDASNIDGSTPLCEACSLGSVKCAKILLKHGANVNPPLLLNTPLHEAAYRGHDNCVKLLIEAGAKLDASDCHFGSPLHAACVSTAPNLNVVNSLLNAGARVNVIKIHKTPLHQAAHDGNYELAELILSYGANPYVRDNQGLTPRDHTKPNTPLYGLLYKAETCPFSLSHYCRLAIRNSIGPKRLRRTGIKELRLPTMLARYLTHYCS